MWEAIYSHYKLSLAQFIVLVKSVYMNKNHIDLHLSA